MVTGHDTDTGPDGATWTSVTEMLSSRVAPLFVTTKEYATVSPALVTSVGEAVLTRVSSLVAALVTVAVDGSVVSGAPVGSVPLATALSTTVPWSMSSWVTVYDAVHVVALPGASSVTGQVTVTAVAGAVAVSVTLRLEIVTLPVLVTWKE